MASITQTIPNFFGGISKVPDSNAYKYKYMRTYSTYTTCTSTLGDYTTASGSPGQEGEQHVSFVA